MNIRSALIGSAGLAAALTVAAPAQAQYYPQPQQQPGYGYGAPTNNGIVGAIINSVTGQGYGQYPMGNYGYAQVNERNAVSMCAAAAEQRLGGGYRQNGYANNGYNNGYGNNGYNNGYHAQAGRVLGITNVERRGNGGLKVTGVATSGQAYAYGNQAYNNGYGQNGYNGQGYGARQTAELQFTCKVNTRGQVSELKIDRNRVGYRGY